MSVKLYILQSQQLVMPGSQEEMAKFQEDTTATSKVHIECSFPQLDVNLHTDDIFEQIYNRYLGSFQSFGVIHVFIYIFLFCLFTIFKQACPVQHGWFKWRPVKNCITQIN